MPHSEIRIAPDSVCKISAVLHKVAILLNEPMEDEELCDAMVEILLQILLDCLHRVISIQLFLPACYNIVPGLSISC